MKSIIIVECISTGKNFIRDIIRRNYNPVVLEPKFDNDENEKLKSKFHEAEYRSIDEDFDLIYEQDTFEETVELVKKFDPLLILPGGENGVVLATKLSNELGLLSNPVESLDSMTLKNEMHNALKKAGIRYIKGQVIYSIEEALEYYKKAGFKDVVVKPLRNAGSYGVSLCSNEEEVQHAVETTLNIDGGTYGEGVKGLVIQERIRGEEYIVNTVSHKGVHRVTTIWKYYKKQTNDGRYIYDYMKSVNELNIAQAEMVEYAYQVADAIGIEYGPVHGEYMIDEQGPVLIEVNCRPCGGDMDERFLDEISGQHETDSILDSYLNPDLFNHERKKRYSLYSFGGLKFFIVPYDISAQSIPMQYIAKRLRSHHKTDLARITDSPIHFSKTKDLDTSGGVIYLNHKDHYTVSKDLKFLRTVEQYAFEQVISEKLNKPIFKDDTYNPNLIKELLEKNAILGTTLLVTDNFVDDSRIVQCKLNQINDISKSFEIVIIDLNKETLSNNPDTNLIHFLDIDDKIKRGGLIFIPKKTYQHIRGKRNGMETLLKALNLKIEVPPYGVKDIIIATKT